MKCSRCQKTNLPIHKHHKGASGVQYYWCRPCSAEVSRIYRTTKRGKKVWAAIGKSQYQKYRKKALARQKVQWAIKQGVLKKPKKCQDCGRVKKLDGHHSDYKFPLKVKFWCRPCHIGFHRKKLLTVRGFD